MIRGQHVDLTILGAMEVSEMAILPIGKYPENGERNGRRNGLSFGRILLAMMHVNKAGEPKS